MASLKSLSILISVLTVAFCASAASFTVGDATGWTVPPTTSFYKTWAAGKEFAVNDNLVFNFETGLHNVMRVSKAEYDACTATSALDSYTTGPATIKLNATGTYYFICSVGAHCNFGQSLSITVGSSSTTPNPSPIAPVVPSPSSSSSIPSTPPSPLPVPSPLPPKSQPSPAAQASTVPPIIVGTGGKNNSVATKIAIALSVGASILVVVLVILFLVRRRRRAQRNSSAHQRQQIAPRIFQVRGKLRPSIRSRKGQLVFSYADVKRITHNFRSVIGRGGSSTVYYGKLDSGEEVAAKKLTRSSPYATKEFTTEVNLLMTVHHKHLLSLIGYCEEGDHLILLYEYMSGGNLNELLSGKTDKMLASDWKLRLDIALAAAIGLEYLHYACKPPIIHRDVKSSNILLDCNFVAKLADFGVSKLLRAENINFTTTVVCGTMGYLDPETNKLTEKSDVFAFGVVLFEILTGQPPLVQEKGEMIPLIQWAKPRILTGNVASWVDSQFQFLEESYLSSIWQVAEVAMNCTAEVSMARPNMTQVIRDLRVAVDFCGETVHIQSSQQESTLPSTDYILPTEYRSPHAR